MTGPFRVLYTRPGDARPQQVGADLETVEEGLVKFDAVARTPGAGRLALVDSEGVTIKSIEETPS